MCAAESPYHSPTWNYRMPSVHPLVTFMGQNEVNLKALYSDGSGVRAGSHALHALALLLEMRQKSQGSNGCYYSCCILPERQSGRSLPNTLSK